MKKKEMGFRNLESFAQQCLLKSNAQEPKGMIKNPVSIESAVCCASEVLQEISTKSSEVSIFKVCGYTVQKQPLEVFCKKGVLRNFPKFTEKHLRQRILFGRDMRPEEQN